jgi:hypothetical protein
MALSALFLNTNSRKEPLMLRNTILAIFILLLALPAYAQDKPTFEVYGFAMMDAGYDAKQVDPAWFDVLRPTKLPAFEDQFGPDGETYFSARQSRLGVKSVIPTDMGELMTIFEFEMFGVGVDAGQTTIRLRHAYGELGCFGAGQYWSPFMDIDVFPNSVEYWGPSGMAFFRNVQARWMPVKGDTRITIALERPGASSDAGVYSGRVELQGVKPRFPLPDLSAEYHWGRPWGYVEAAGIVRRMEWEDMNADSLDLSGDALGWGLNFSSNIKLGDDNIVKLQVVYGEGIENYFNDAPVDVGVENNPGNATSPIKGVALPALGVVAFLDHTWNDRFSSSVGYSMVDIDNSSGQAPSAFKKGHYALGNLMYHPVPNASITAEFQWGRRENFSDGWTVDDYRMQFSFKYNFSMMFGG